MVERRRQDGGHFFCPNGHSQHFTESEVARLSKKLEEQMRVATKMAECARMAERSAQKAQAETKRLKRRISAGVCPCCNRTFQNLARHMKSKHPETTP
jgi:chromosome segregation ATPase